MHFPLNIDGTKMFCVTTVDNNITLEFLTPKRSLAFHPQACQKLEGLQDTLKSCINYRKE